MISRIVDGKSNITLLEIGCADGVIFRLQNGESWQIFRTKNNDYNYNNFENGPSEDKRKRL